MRKITKNKCDSLIFKTKTYLEAVFSIKNKESLQKISIYHNGNLRVLRSKAICAREGKMKDRHVEEEEEGGRKEREK